MTERRFVSIHARLATGDAMPAKPRVRRSVSIHARLATGDPFLILFLPTLMFQFTPVLRRATGPIKIKPSFTAVSIHARLATGDRDNLCNYRHSKTTNRL